MPKRLSQRALSLLGVFTAYLGVSILITWPLARNINTVAAGHEGNDTWNHLWGFWWVKDELLRLGQFPTQTNLINHPKGGSLYFIDMAGALLSLPLQDTLGLIAAYNIVVLLQLALNGFGAFLLANHLVRSPWAASVAGLIYGSSAHLLAQTHNGISETINAGFLPIFILFFIRTMEERRLGNAIAAGLFLFLNTFFNWYYGLFGVLFALLYTAYSLFSKGLRILNRQLLGRLVLSGIVYVILITPFLALFRSTLSADDAIVGRDPRFVWQTLLHHNMTDARIFFTPGDFYSPDLHALFGEDLIIVAYLGYGALLLAALGAWAYRKRETPIWIALTALFFLFALGPYLYWDGHYVEISGRWVPLPFLLFFEAIPLFSRISHPFRFVVMVQLSLGLLAAFGLKALFTHYFPRQLAPLGAFVAGAVILGEVAFASPAILPLETSSGAIPSFYVELGEESENYAILDLPVGVPNLRRAVYTYYQTAHHKAVPYSLNDPFPSILKDNYFMRYMVNLEFSGVDRLPPLLPELDLLVSLETLKADGYRYIVIHEELYPRAKPRERVLDVLEAFVGVGVRYPKDGIVVYELK